MRKLALVAAAVLLAVAGLGASFAVAGLGATAGGSYTTVTKSTSTGDTTGYTTVTEKDTTESQPSTVTVTKTVTVTVTKSTTTEPVTSTITKSTTTVTQPTTTRPPPVVTLGPPQLICELGDDTAPFLRLNVVAAGDTATTIGMEKDVLQCSGAATQTRDLETFIEVVQQATPTGLADVDLRVQTTLCMKDFSAGRVQCSRRNVPVGGDVANPLYGCKNGGQQPADPVQMVSKGVGGWFKTTKLEKQVVQCPNGTLADVYLFTDVLSTNPPTATPSTTSFRGIVCQWTPSTGLPPLKCNTIKTT